jgi:hypothetical protein
MFVLVGRTVHHLDEDGNTVNQRVLESRPTIIVARCDGEFVYYDGSTVVTPEFRIPNVLDCRFLCVNPVNLDVVVESVFDDRRRVSVWRNQECTMTFDGTGFDFIEYSRDLTKLVVVSSGVIVFNVEDYTEIARFENVYARLRDYYVHLMTGVNRWDVSPDGHKLVFLTRQSVIVLDVFDGTQTSLPLSADGSSFSPDGAMVLVDGRTSIFVYDYTLPRRFLENSFWNKDVHLDATPLTKTNGRRTVYYGRERLLISTAEGRTVKVLDFRERVYSVSFVPDVGNILM